MDTVVEGGSGTNGESSINIYTLSYRKWIVGKKSLGSFSFKCLAKLYFMLFYSVLCWQVYSEKIHFFYSKPIKATLCIFVFGSPCGCDYVFEVGAPPGLPKPRWSTSKIHLKTKCIFSIEKNNRKYKQYILKTHNFFKIIKGICQSLFCLFSIFALKWTLPYFKREIK